MKMIFLPLIVTCVFTISAHAQSPKRVVKKLGNEPAFFIDSVSISKEDLSKYNPEQIAAVTVYKEKTAMELLGEEGKDGAVYIETRAFARSRYWKYFSSKSKEYALAVPSAAEDSTVQYILNGKVLKGNFEGNLSSIDDKFFKGITVISKEALQREYGVTDKRLGIVILSSTPGSLYKGKEKFNE
jgi:hypothetical protein